MYHVSQLIFFFIEMLSLFSLISLRHYLCAEFLNIPGHLVFIDSISTFFFSSSTSEFFNSISQFVVPLCFVYFS